MKTHERSIESYGSEDGVTDRDVVREYVPMAERSATGVIVLHEAVRRTEVEVGTAQVLTQLKTEAAIEYKNYQLLIDRAVDVFGDELTASRWLSTPSADLNGDVPLQVAQGLRYAPARLEEVFEPIFIRIEHGIYS